MPFRFQMPSGMSSATRQLKRFFGANAENQPPNQDLRCLRAHWVPAWQDRSQFRRWLIEVRRSGVGDGSANAWSLLVWDSISCGIELRNPIQGLELKDDTSNRAFIIVDDFDNMTASKLLGFEEGL